MSARDEFLLPEDQPEVRQSSMQQFVEDWSPTPDLLNEGAWRDQRAANYALDSAPDPRTPRDVYGTMNIGAARDHFEPAVADERQLAMYARKMETLVSAGNGTTVELLPWLMDLPLSDIDLLLEAEMLAPGAMEDLKNLQQAEAYAATERIGVLEEAERRANLYTRNWWDTGPWRGEQRQRGIENQAQREAELLADPAFIEQVRDDIYNGVSPDARMLIEELWSGYIGDDGEVLRATVLNELNNIDWAGHEWEGNHWIVDNLLNSPLFNLLPGAEDMTLPEKIDALSTPDQEAFWEEAKLVVERAVVNRIKDPDYTTTDIKSGGGAWNSFWRGVGRNVVGPTLGWVSAAFEGALAPVAGAFAGIHNTAAIPTDKIDPVATDSIFRELHEGKIATQIRLTNEARERVEAAGAGIDEWDSQTLDQAFRGTMMVDFLGMFRQAVENNDALANEMILAAGGDEDLGFALWQEAVNDTMDDDAKRQILHSLNEAEGQQLRDFVDVLEESDYQPGVTLLQWFAAYDQMVMGVPTTAMLLMGGEENSWLPEDTSWSEAWEIAQDDYDGMPSKVLGWDGTITGLASDILVGTIFDPLTWLTTPGGAAGARAASEGAVRHIVSGPMAQRAVREMAEGLAEDVSQRVARAAAGEVGESVGRHTVPVVSWMPDHIRLNLLERVDAAGSRSAGTVKMSVYADSVIDPENLARFPEEYGRGTVVRASEGQNLYFHGSAAYETADEVAERGVTGGVSVSPVRSAGHLDSRGTPGRIWVFDANDVPTERLDLPIEERYAGMPQESGMHSTVGEMPHDIERLGEGDAAMHARPVGYIDPAEVQDWWRRARDLEDELGRPLTDAEVASLGDLTIHDVDALTEIYEATNEAVIQSLLQGKSNTQLSRSMLSQNVGAMLENIADTRGVKGFIDLFEDRLTLRGLPTNGPVAKERMLNTVAEMFYYDPDFTAVLQRELMDIYDEAAAIELVRSRSAQTTQALGSVFGEDSIAYRSLKAILNRGDERLTKAEVDTLLGGGTIGRSLPVPDKGGTFRLINNLEELEAWASVHNVGERLQSFWDRVYDEFNNQRILNGPHGDDYRRLGWVDTNDEGLEIVNWDRLLGVEDTEKLGTRWRVTTAEQDSIIRQHIDDLKRAADDAGIELPDGVEERMLLELANGDAPIGDVLARAANSGYNSTPNVHFRVSPAEMVALSRFSPDAGVLLQSYRRVREVYRHLHAAFVLDKVVTPSTGIVVAADEWLSLFMHYGSFDSLIKYLKMTNEKRVAGWTARHGGALTQRQKELLNNLHRVPSIQRALEAFNDPGRGASRVSLKAGDPGFEEAATKFIDAHLQDPAWNAYHRMDRDEWLVWFREDPEAEGLRRTMMNMYEDVTKAERRPIAAEEAYDLLNTVFEKMYYGGSQADMSQIRTLMREGAEASRSGARYTPDPALVDGMPSVLGTGGKPKGPLQAANDFFLRHFFESSMNKRRSFVYQMEDTIERTRLERLFVSQGYEILEWDEIMSILGAGVGGSPWMRRAVAEELLRSPLPGGRKIIPRTYIDDLVEDVAAGTMDELMYKWHTVSSAEKGLRPVAPFVGPWADMQRRWGTKLFGEKTNWRWLSTVDNPNKIQTTLRNALESQFNPLAHVNMRTYSRLSRIANNSLELTNMEEDPIFGDLGFKELDFTPLMFLPTQGNDPYATFIPGLGPVPLVIADELMFRMADEDPTEFKKIADWAGNFNTFLRFSKFGGASTNLINRLIGNGNVSRVMGWANDIDTIMKVQQGQSVSPFSTPFLQFNGDVSLQTAGMQELMTLVAAEAGDELFEMLFDKNLDGNTLAGLLEGYGAEAMLRASQQHLAQSVGRSLLPVNARVYGVADQVSEAWNNVARSNPDLFPDWQLPQDADATTRDKYGSKVRTAYFEMDEQVRNLLIVQNPELVVNMVSRWRWTSKAEQELGARTELDYKTDGTPTSLDEHYAFIDAGYIEPRPLTEMAFDMMGFLGSAYRDATDDIWEQTFTNLNDDFWENTLPQDVKDRYQWYYDNGAPDVWNVEDPKELWEAWSSIYDDIRDQIIMNGAEEIDPDLDWIRNQLNELDQPVGPDGLMWSDIPAEWQDDLMEGYFSIPTDLRALSVSYTALNELDTSPSASGYDSLITRLVQMEAIDTTDLTTEIALGDKTDLTRWLPDNASLYADVLGLDLESPSYSSLWYDTKGLQDSMGYAAGVAGGFNQQDSTDRQFNSLTRRDDVPVSVRQTVDEFNKQLFFLDRRVSREGGRRVTVEEQALVRQTYQNIMIQFGWDGVSEEFSAEGVDFMDYYDRKLRRKFGDLTWEPPNIKEQAPLFDDDGRLSQDAMLPMDIQITDGDSLTARITDRSYPIGNLLNRISNSARPEGVFEFRLLGIRAADYGRNEESTAQARLDEQRLKNAVAEAEANGEPVYLVFDRDFAGSRVDAFGRGLVWLYIGDEPYQMENPAEGYIPRNR